MYIYIYIYIHISLYIGIRICAYNYLILYIQYDAMRKGKMWAFECKP